MNINSNGSNTKESSGTCLPRTAWRKLPWLDGRSSVAPSPGVSPNPDPSAPCLATNEPPGISGSPSARSPARGEHIFITYSDEEATRSRAHRLAPVPNHLEQSEAEQTVYVRSSPRQPIPTRTFFERNGSRRLTKAIEGLEYMVQDAVVTAEHTEHPEHVEKLYEIIESAKDAMQEISVDPTTHLLRKQSPLAASHDKIYYNSSGLHLQPDTVIESDQTEHISLSPASRLQNSNQKRTKSVDWAYEKEKGNRHNSFVSSSSTTSSLLTPDKSGSRDLLLPPEGIQAAIRDHVDHVVRPTLHHEHSRGRSHERETQGDERCHRRRRHRHHHRHRHHTSHSDDSRPRSLRGRRYYMASDGSKLDTSFDEEDLHAAGKPNGIRKYGPELHMEDTVHHHTFSLRRHHRRQPIARNWRTGKKRITALIACFNTAVIGIIAGIYAGEVPRIQYMLADEKHIVIVGNVVLYFGLAISTLIFWPLPLLHGRKPYILAALAIAMPLQFPQALIVGVKRSPCNPSFRTGLLLARALTGLVLGFANVNFIAILLDLFGASLQSKHPHQEFTVVSDVRRHGGGMGIWLGLWSWCWIGSLAGGFQIGAGIIDSLTPDWGFYITIIILVVALFLNVLAPETRRSAYRRSITEVYDRDENYITRRVARGEIKLHLSPEGPKYWFEEVWAGLKLSFMMLCQPGFLILSIYLGWIYAQIVLVIVLLGSLLSRDYKWHSQYVGLGVMSIAIGALLAIPLTKAGIFSRERKEPFRTDSMTFKKQVTWSSHLIRRCIFTLILPLMGLAYTVSSAGRPKPYMVPILFAGAVGFLSILAIAECHGLIMETFDTCDLQPGVNTRHRIESLAVQDRRRRTNYSSFPRVSAGFFTSQFIAFIGAAVATQIGGIMTRHVGAQTSTGVTAGILLFLTILLVLVLWRFKKVQVIPNYTFGTRRDTVAWQEFKELEKEGKGPEWKAVVIGNPSGKMRRMNVLELGALSRWTEIRKLNFLIRDKDRDDGRVEWHR